MPDSYLLRLANLKNVNADGIPRDFAQEMEYFNLGLKVNAYTFIPRKNPITIEEIRDKWMSQSSLENNITFLAEEISQPPSGKIVGSATVFFDTSATDYAESQMRKPGEVALTVHPDYSHFQVGRELMQVVKRALEITKLKATLHTHEDFKAELAIMQTLFPSPHQENPYSKTPQDYERYKKAGLSGEVYEFHLP